MIFLELLWSFIQVGLFSIGGGYAALPLIQDQVVAQKSWLTLSEFTDIITISEMTPGPISINTATFVGMQVAGFPGAVIATLGCILPSCLIVTLLAFLYYRYRKLTLIQGVLGGLRPTVVALIASAGVTIILLALFDGKGFSFHAADFDLTAAVLFTAAFFILRKWKPNPVFVMLGCGAVGAAAYLLF